mgnify:CR=1 FL=1
MKQAIGAELSDLPEVFKTQEYNLWLLEACVIALHAHPL